MSLAGTVMVPKTAAVLPRCMAIAILCSRWWCDRGSPVFTRRWCPTSWRKIRASCPNTPAVSIATGIKRWLDCRSAYFTLSYRQPDLQRHQPHLWPASRGMGQRCRGMSQPKQGLDHASRVLLLNHIVSSHWIGKYQMVSVGQGLQLWPVITGSARWLLHDEDADLGSWDG